LAKEAAVYWPTLREEMTFHVICSDEWAFFASASGIFRLVR
jgi:hypothetical protein